ncbi:MAG: hypothetical protein ACLFUG_10950 [Nitriliruptoraceae bacterium]
MRRYPTEQLWEELTELAYHLHWSFGDLLDLQHRDRTRLLASVRALRRQES